MPDFKSPPLMGKVIFEDDQFMVIALGDKLDSNLCFEICRKEGPFLSFVPYGPAAQVIRAQAEAWQFLPPLEAEVDEFFTQYSWVNVQPFRTDH